MSTPGGGDKRSHARMPLILQVEYPEQEGFVADATENLSAGGAFVRTTRELRAGERVPLALSFPGLLDPVEIVGEVAWVRPGEAGLPSGVGLRIPGDRAADRDRLAQLLERMGRAQPRARSYRILLVEDNPHLLEMYEYAIQKLARSEGFGVEVALARDGGDALARLCAESIHLVITDLYMPGLDGFELIRRIRSEPRTRDLPVLAISAGASEAMGRSRAAGANAFLRKPVRFLDVIETVRSLLKL